MFVSGSLRSAVLGRAARACQWVPDTELWTDTSMQGFTCDFLLDSDWCNAMRCNGSTVMSWHWAAACLSRAKKMCKAWCYVVQFFERGLDLCK